MQIYELAEAREAAFISYQLAISKKSPEEHKAFRSNKALYEMVLGLFYKAKNQDEWDGYMDKTPVELADIAAQMGTSPMRLNSRANVNAFAGYKAALLEKSPAEYKMFHSNRTLYETVLFLFYGAKNQDERDSYMDKTPTELADIAAQMGISPLRSNA